MKALFVFYSLEGNCRALAESMAGSIGGETVELRPVAYDIPTKGIMKYLRGGKDALLKKTPELHLLTAAIDGRDVIVVGSPVWFGRMTPPVRTFLEGVDWTGRKAAVFAMHRGGKGSAARDMAAIIRRRGGTVVATTNFRDLRGKEAEATLEGAIAWARTLAEKAGI